MRSVYAHTRNRLFAIGAISLLWSVAGRLSFAQGSAELSVEELVQLWETQRSEIVSAAITYRVFNDSDIFAPLSADQAETLFGAYDLADRPDDLKVMVNRLLANPPFRTEQPWAIHDFLYEGSRTRHEGESTVDVFDAEARIEVDRGNEVVKLQRPGVSPTYPLSLDDFRIIPSERVTAKAIRLRRRESGRLVLGVLLDSEGWDADVDPIVLEVDAGTGLVQREVVYRQDGQVYRQRIQYGFRTYPGDIVFPTVVLEARYWNRSLGGLKVSIVEEARFNEPLQADAFAVAVTGGTAIFDERGDERRVFHAPSATHDVKELVDRMGTIRASGRHGFRAAALVIGGVLLVIVAVVLWRRSRIGRRAA